MTSVLTSLNNFVSATVESGAIIDVDNENKEIKSIVTDASGNYIKSSEIKQTADTISAKVKDLSTGLADTGIDIENHQITLTANNIKVKNNSGALVSAIDEYGQLTSGSVQTLDTGSGHVNIKDGLISIFNSSDICNIRFGLKDGYMVMSYYNNDGQLLYDLGPKGLDFTQIHSGSIESVYCYEMQDFCGAPDDKIYYTTETYKVSDYMSITYPTAVSTKYQLGSNYYDSERYFFPRSMTREIDGIENDDPYSDEGQLVDITGKKPEPQKNVKTVILYKYNAARLNGVAIADSARGLTAEQAEEANGKYFTTNSNLGASDGINLQHMANGWYIRTNETIDQAGYRFDEEDGKTYKVPRYVLNTDRFSNGVYQTVVFASYAKRVFINGVESETECT
jgi:hypothetical protein